MVKIYCPPLRSCFLHYEWWFPAASAVHSGVHIFVPDFCYFEFVQSLIAFLQLCRPVLIMWECLKITLFVLTNHCLIIKKEQRDPHHDESEASLATWLRFKLMIALVQRKLSDVEGVYKASVMHHLGFHWHHHCYYC